MMSAINALAERVRADHFTVEAVAWEWAAKLRMAAERCASIEAAVLADTVERTIAAEGADGLVDIAIAGPMCGGIGCNDVRALVRLVDERLAGHALAA
ncbi:hypothetical protein [Microbacterium sp. B24]|uniref:hypothetical protein n=1 Tax=Microbacterium sp. B24 TaxID=95616 RepID=UPI00055E65BC|nr:hypothetical protein [Microbacterium sp. B24]